MVAHRLDMYPYPMAYPVRRYEVAHDQADRLARAEECIEVWVGALAVMTLGWCRTREVTPGGMTAWESKLDKGGGPTLGDNIALLRSARKAMLKQGEDPVAKVLALAIGGSSEGLETFQKAIRNPYAHGARPRVYSDQRAAADDLEKDISVLLDALEPVTRLRVGLVRSCGVRQAEVEELTGPGEPFGVVRLRVSQPYDEGSLAVYPAGTLTSAVVLGPYAVWRRCPTCHRDEMFHLNKRKSKGARSHYLAFRTGHAVDIKGDVIREAERPPVALGMQPMSSTRSRSRSGWRATWTELAPRGKRVTARMVDLVIAAVAGVVVWLGTGVVGGSLWVQALLGGITVLAYEPVAGLNGGTPGKRLLRLEPISTWNQRSLARSDVIRRALLLNVHLLFPPLAVRSLAWLLWDPARQCMHDRLADTVVIDGRAGPGHKV